MEALVNEVAIDVQELARYRSEYTTAVREGQPAENKRFAYAWALICTPDRGYISEGAGHLKDMLKNTQSQDSSRTYLFYLAVASTKLKEYQDALQYLEALRRIDPNNAQLSQLESFVRKRMEKDGAIGAAVVGGAAVMGVAGLVGLGVLLAKGLKK